MIFLLLIELSVSLVSFMLAPVSVVFPFELVSIVYTFLDYITVGVNYVTFFCFDAWVLRSVFSFILSVNIVLFGFDLIWRILGYIKLNREN